MLMHSLTDFNMHNGADGLYFFFFCGLLVAAVNTRFEYCQTKTLLKKQESTRNISYLVATVVLTVLVSAVQYGVLRASAEYGKVKDIYINQRLSASRLQEFKHGMSMAKRFDPLEQLYNFKLGTAEWDFKQPCG